MTAPADAAIRRASIAESARIAAQLAADTHSHQENPHPDDAPEYLIWEAAYHRHFDAITNPDGEGGA